MYKAKNNTGLLAANGMNHRNVGEVTRAMETEARFVPDSEATFLLQPLNLSDVVPRVDLNLLNSK